MPPKICLSEDQLAFLDFCIHELINKNLNLQNNFYYQSTLSHDLILDIFLFLFFFYVVSLFTYVWCIQNLSISVSYNMLSVIK
jgi:hypothetical protein